MFRATPSGHYPRYFLQNFHYQTDGYLSRRSAELYDHQVEVLFGGAADAMRRQALVPLRRVLMERGVRGARLIDLACGTGRFLREVKRNYPRLAVTALDLSPFYLDEARRALAPWPDAAFIAAPAERVPLADASAEVVTSLFLFHELPEKSAARWCRRWRGSWFRAARPSSSIPSSLATFPTTMRWSNSFPAPFTSPITRNTPARISVALFAEAGLTLEESRIAYFAKVMTLRKPDDRGERTDDR